MAPWRNQAIGQAPGRNLPWEVCGWSWSCSFVMVLVPVGIPIIGHWGDLGSLHCGGDTAHGMPTPGEGTGTGRRNKDRNSPAVAHGSVEGAGCCVGRMENLCSRWWPHHWDLLLHRRQMDTGGFGLRLMGLAPSPAALGVFDLLLPEQTGIWGCARSALPMGKCAPHWALHPVGAHPGITREQRTCTRGRLFHPSWRAARGRKNQLIQMMLLQSALSGAGRSKCTGCGRACALHPPWPPLRKDQLCPQSPILLCRALLDASGLDPAGAATSPSMCSLGCRALVVTVAGSIP